MMAGISSSSVRFRRAFFFYRRADWHLARSQICSTLIRGPRGIRSLPSSLSAGQKTPPYQLDHEAGFSVRFHRALDDVRALDASQSRFCFAVFEPLGGRQSFCVIIAVSFLMCVPVLHSILCGHRPAFLEIRCSVLGLAWQALVGAGFGAL